jgi:hypothetical protein
MNWDERIRIITNCRRWKNSFIDDDGSIVAYSKKKGIAVMQRRFEGWWEIVEKDKDEERYNEIVEYCQTFN